MGPAETLVFAALAVGTLALAVALAVALAQVFSSCTWLSALPAAFWDDLLWVFLEFSLGFLEFSQSYLGFSQSFLEFSQGFLEFSQSFLGVSLGFLPFSLRYQGSYRREENREGHVSSIEVYRMVVSIREPEGHAPQCPRVDLKVILWHGRVLVNHQIPVRGVHWTFHDNASRPVWPNPAGAAKGLRVQI